MEKGDIRIRVFDSCYSELFVYLPTDYMSCLTNKLISVKRIVVSLWKSVGYQAREKIGKGTTNYESCCTQPKSSK